MYITLASIFKSFIKSQESELTILIAFLPLNTVIKAIFSYHVQLSRNIMSNSKKDHKQVNLVSEYFMVDEVFKFFQTHMVDRTVELDIILNS